MPDLQSCNAFQRLNTQAPSSSAKLFRESLGATAILDQYKTQILERMDPRWRPLTTIRSTIRILNSASKEFGASIYNLKVESYFLWQISSTVCWSWRKMWVLRSILCGSSVVFSWTTGTVILLWNGCPEHFLVVSDNRTTAISSTDFWNWHYWKFVLRHKEIPFLGLKDVRAKNFYNTFFSYFGYS